MPRIPPNAFGAAFGLSGLAGTWSAAAGAGLAPQWIAQALLAVAAVTWLAVIVGYLACALGRRGLLRADLTHPVLSPFLSLALITPMVLASAGIAPHAPAVGAALTDLFIALVLLHGAWFTGQLIYGDYALDQLHPGYFLPTVAGGLIAAMSAAAIAQPVLGRLMLGYGVVCWFVLGSIILARLVFRPTLPAALAPTLAIEVAPAAVASLAWFGLHGGVIDEIAQFLAGYGVLMVLAQLRLLPMFLRLRFSTSFWAFTFSWAAVASVVLHWLIVTRPSGYVAWAWIVLAAITVLIGAIAVRSIAALVAGTLFPSSPAAAPPAAAPARQPEESVIGAREAH
jgi:tellurite resistance protein